jgi:hypothetical protein
MIDRQARSRIRSIVDDFLDRKITAFTFDDQLQAIETKDATAQEVMRALWFTYDDLRDHGPERWSKPVWDQVQRLLLVLDGDLEITQIKCRWRWRWSQAVALVGLLVVVVLFWNDHGLALMLIGGAISKAIAWWHGRYSRDDDPAEAAPFASPAQIRRALRRIPGWRKRRHPGGSTPRLRSRCLEWLYGCNGGMLWCLCSPVVLVLQALSVRSSRTMVSSGRGSH